MPCRTQGVLVLVEFLELRLKSKPVQTCSQRDLNLLNAISFRVGRFRHGVLVSKSGGLGIYIYLGVAILPRPKATLFSCPKDTFTGLSGIPKEPSRGEKFRNYFNKIWLK